MSFLQKLQSAAFHILDDDPTILETFAEELLQTHTVIQLNRLNYFQYPSLFE